MFEQVTSTFELLLQQVQSFQRSVLATLRTVRIGFRCGQSPELWQRQRCLPAALSPTASGEERIPYTQEVNGSLQVSCGNSACSIV